MAASLRAALMSARDAASVEAPLSRIATMVAGTAVLAPVVLHWEASLLTHIGSGSTAATQSASVLQSTPFFVAQWPHPPPSTPASQKGVASEVCSFSPTWPAGGCWPKAESM